MNVSFLVLLSDKFSSKMVSNTEYIERLSISQKGFNKVNKVDSFYGSDVNKVDSLFLNVSRLLLPCRRDYRSGSPEIFGIQNSVV